MKIRTTTTNLQREFTANDELDLLEKVASVGAGAKELKAVKDAWNRLEAGESGFTKILFGSKVRFAALNY